MDQETVKHLFDYRDGELFWRVNSSRAKIGARAGSDCADGYRQVSIGKRKLVMEHRVIFLWHHGYLPDEIDHIDRNKSNSRIENLRAVTHRQNMRNSSARKNNVSGVKGVSWHKNTGKWIVQLGVNGRKKYVGVYDDLDLAQLVAEEARRKYHGEFACHG